MFYFDFLDYQVSGYHCKEKGNLIRKAISQREEAFEGYRDGTSQAGN